MKKLTSLAIVFLNISVAHAFCPDLAGEYLCNDRPSSIKQEQIKDGMYYFVSIPGEWGKAYFTDGREVLQKEGAYDGSDHYVYGAGDVNVSECTLFGSVKRYTKYSLWDEVTTISRKWNGDVHIVEVTHVKPYVNFPGSYYSHEFNCVKQRHDSK